MRDDTLPPDPLPPPDDNTTVHDSTRPQPATTGEFGRYELRGVLGRGGFGTVFRAYDPLLHREVALKVPHDSAAAETFLREARAAAALRHAHIVPVFDVGFAGEVPFLTMELVAGDSAAKQVKSGEPLSPRQVAAWGRSVALALHVAHAAGMVHRDVKPGNILIDADGRARLTDFGLTPVTAGIAGTPAYMAPEQARGEPLDARADVYALGATLYELLTGRRPFEGKASAVVEAVADPLRLPLMPREVRRDLPIALEAVVWKAMAKDPVGRYASAAEFAVDVQRWLNGDPVTAPLMNAEGLVRLCPHCGRVGRPTEARCKYCGSDMTAVEPVEPITDRQEQVKRLEAEAEKADEREARGDEYPWRGRREALASLLSAGVLLLFLYTFVANWREATAHAAFHKRTPPGFFECQTVLPEWTPLVQGIAIGAANIVGGLLLIFALNDLGRLVNGLRVALPFLATAVAPLAVVTEFSARYEYSTPQQVTATVVSRAGREMAAARLWVVSPNDRAIAVKHNTVFVDAARARAIEPEDREAGGRAVRWKGTVTWRTSPLGLAAGRGSWAPAGLVSPEECRLITSYADDPKGSCFCDLGSGHHDHHSFPFPLHLIADGGASEWAIVVP